MLKFPYNNIIAKNATRCRSIVKWGELSEGSSIGITLEHLMIND
jgi:hypothetical protein